MVRPLAECGSVTVWAIIKDNITNRGCNLSSGSDSPSWCKSHILNNVLNKF